MRITDNFMVGRIFTETKTGHSAKTNEFVKFSQLFALPVNQIAYSYLIST